MNHTRAFCVLTSCILVAVLILRRNMLLSPVPWILKSTITQKITVTLKKIPILDIHCYRNLWELNVCTVLQYSALLLRKEFLNTSPPLTYVVREFISRNVEYKTIPKSEPCRTNPHSPLEVLFTVSNFDCCKAISFKFNIFVTFPWE